MRVLSALCRGAVALAISCGVLACDESDGTDPSTVLCDPGFFGVDCEPCPAGSTCDGSTVTPTQCAVGTWDHDGDSTTECEAWTSCVPGEKVASAGSRTEDRTCSRCEEGTFSSATNAASCDAWSDCRAGTFVDTEGTATEDRTCSGCPSGTFSAESNQEVCATWTECTPGTFVDVAGSASEDQTCAECPEGETTETSNAASCTPFGACPAGTAGEECAPCDAGQYCAGDDAPALACAAGTWDHDADPATPCADWTECVAGERESEAGSTTQDRGCVDCTSGTYTSESNQTECDAWTECAPGTSVASEGSTTADRACTPCVSGTFSDTANAEACVAWSDCVAGQQVDEPGTASSDRTCAECPEGTFSVSANVDVCTDWTECPAGTAERSGGSELIDVTCDTCAAGSFCPGGDTPETPCADGTWDHDGSAATECVAWTVCGPGFAQGSAGTNTADRTCAPCEDGTFSDDSGAEECTTWTNCVAGQRVSTTPSAERDRACEPCASGHFSTASNVEVCERWSDCVPGEFEDVAGSPTADRVCDDCPEDTYSASPNAAVCTPIGACPAGTTETEPGSPTAPPTCAACAAGTFCAGGTAEPVPCPEGEWDHDANPASECEARGTCGPGTFVIDDGDATTDRSCDDCAAGTFSTGANAAECDPWSDCASGTFVSTAGDVDADRACADCDPGYTDAENQSECAEWSPACGGPEFAAPTSTSDRVCADTTPCVELSDEEACRRSVLSCAWDGACSEQACAAISDPDTCSRYPECEFDYASSFSCADDPTPPGTCAEITNAERCLNSALACEWDTEAGGCVDAGTPTDCTLGGFEDWSACSKPCDGGERSRQQQVIEEARGGLCDPAFQTEPCNVGVECTCDLYTDEFSCGAADGCAWSGSACDDAPVDCVLGDWSEFSSCSLPCDGGTQTRTRPVLVEPANGGAPCGLQEESQPCNAGIPCVCSELTTDEQCASVDDCAWRNDRCEYDGPVLECDAIDNQAECQASTLNCIWIDSIETCLSAP